MDPAAHREAELLGFQIGIERGNPGSLMCAYNKVNGEYACGNDTLLNKQIKGAIGFKGFIMSDWKAVVGGPCCWRHGRNAYGCAARRP
ncbi:glycoside hydrolase family 3 N-terminal domain-containing protein [Cupriavidus sp. AcVe19-1a]|uniref:glycoside hydrolase family 3 N-terminal domain-containing protein n=1 Tax=Cupriavidus sp. AcVe19-1a TaxID=2821359 RepID=UPI001AE5C9A2|nr:hypothetical protein [Cupriavidus sp. AcVe19-1a]